jgi:hypothetical protein
LAPTPLIASSPPLCHPLSLRFDVAISTNFHVDIGHRNQWQNTSINNNQRAPQHPTDTLNTMAKSIILILLFTFLCNINNSHFGPRSVQAAANKQRREKENNQRKQQRSRQQSGGQQKSKNSGPDDPYKILGVKKNAKEKEIKSAYRKLALKYHVSCTYFVVGISLVC